MRRNHRWRQKTKHQQICTACGQVRRWDGFRWLYRRQGQLVRQLPACSGERTDSQRYAELRILVEMWRATRTESHASADEASERLTHWRHR